MDLSEMNENWQKNAPTLAAMEKTNPFIVPDGYFEDLKEQLRLRVSIENFDNNENLYTVPENYFEALEDNIILRSKLEQLRAPALEPFAVPESYFENLEEKIKARLQPQRVEESKPKIKRLFSSWTTYAAAASIAVIVSFGIFFNSNDNGAQNLDAQLAQLPTEEIVDYLQLYSDAGDAPVIIESIRDESELSQISSEISAQEIEQYLKLNL